MGLNVGVGVRARTAQLLTLVVCRSGCLVTWLSWVSLILTMGSFTSGRRRPAAENLSQRSDKSHELHFSLSNFYLLLSPSARPLRTEMDNALEKFILSFVQWQYHSQ